MLDTRGVGNKLESKVFTGDSIYQSLADYRVKIYEYPADHWVKIAAASNGHLRESIWSATPGYS